MCPGAGVGSVPEVGFEEEDEHEAEDEGEQDQEDDPVHRPSADHQLGGGHLPRK